MNKVNIITLGCSKNLVDSEMLATYLSKNNIEVLFDKYDDSAKIVVINTCGFIADAKEESIDTILEFAQLKEESAIEKIYVMGCLSERYKKELKEEIPEVDDFFGVNDLPQILQTLRADYKKELYGERLISTPSHYAYLKIAEGCNRKCSFCAIPAIRGPHISQSIEKLTAQAKYLTSKGVKELLLISQDTAYYGKDLYGDFKLKELTEELLKIEQLVWLRLHYLYPTFNIVPIIELMAQNKKLCDYIDIPFQHISNKILRSMRRAHNEKIIRDLVEIFRNKVPLGALRSTFIVGYPGETDKDFQKLVDFIQEVKFDRLGVFTYSEEEGTYAATLPDDVPEKVKIQRMDTIMEIQKNISLEKNQKKIGNTLKVIIDRKENDYFVARTEYDSPEVDNEVLIKADNLKIGEFYNVRIFDAFEYDLLAEIMI
jgi:ribosomal protein S12 methylthiotransferase